MKKILNYYLNNPYKVKDNLIYRYTVTKYNFILIKHLNGYIHTHKKDLETYLKSEGFIQNNNGGFRCGFVSFDEKKWLISHDVSNGKTSINGNLQNYIDYFKRL